MRPRKLKLAAVVMSAIMAAGTASMTAFAEDIDATEVAVEAEEVGETVELEESELAADVEEVFEFDENSVEWDYDSATGDVYATYTLVGDQGNVKQQKEKAAIIKTVPATYKEGTQLTAQITVTGKAVSNVIQLNDILESDNWVRNVSVVTKAATCDEDGLKNIVDYNLIPDATLNADNSANEADVISSAIVESDVVIPALGHDYAKTVVLEAGENTRIVDGKAELIDPNNSGTYYEITTEVCKVCGDKQEKREEKKLNSTVADSEGAAVTDSENIAGVIGSDGELRDIVGVALKDVPSDISKIQLIDCSKPGKYTVTYWTADGEDVAFTQTETVAAHHTEKVSIVLKDQKDAGLVKIDQKKMTVTNLVCNKDIPYYVVTECVAEKHGKKTELGREEKVAKSSDVHNINKELKEELSKADLVIDNDRVAELTKNAKTYGIKVSDNTATCKADGTVKITFLCNVCGKEADAVTVKVKKHEAKPGKPELVTIEKATCTKEGLAKRVVKCEICGTEIESTEIAVKKLDHTNLNVNDKEAALDLVGDIVVASYPLEKGLYSGQYHYNAGNESRGVQIGMTGYAVTARVYTVCKTCGEYKNYIASPKVEVVDVTVQGKDGTAGSVTLKATYVTEDTKEAKTLTDTITVPYYSSWLAYLDRKDTSVNLKNGLTKDADDVWRVYEKGEFQKEYNGIIEYNGSDFFIANGELCSDANGLNLYDGKWYFLSQGQVQRGHDGFAEYDGNWFMIKNGELDETANGLYEYNGGTFLFAAGRLCKEVNGLWQNTDGTWYFLAEGQVVNYTGVAEYDGAFFYVENGKLASDYNGTVEYDGATFNVVAGQLYDKVAS